MSTEYEDRYERFVCRCMQTAVVISALLLVTLLGAIASHIALIVISDWRAL